MKVVINGFDGIVADLKADSDKELASFKADVDKRKSELLASNEQLFGVEREKILREAKKRADLEFSRRVSRAKVEVQDKLLLVKERLLNEIFKEVESSLASLKLDVRVSFVNKLAENALSQFSEPIDFIEATKGAKLSVKNVEVRYVLDELGVIVHAKSGAVVNLTQNELLSLWHKRLLGIIAGELEW